MFKLDLQLFASKKGVGSTKNGRDSKSKRLGAKLSDGQFATAGSIIYRQRGTKIHPGTNVGKASADHCDVLKTALDEACKRLQKAGIGTTCDEEHHRQCRENHCFNTCRYARPLTEEEWKELLMEKAERSLSNNNDD